MCCARFSNGLRFVSADVKKQKKKKKKKREKKRKHEEKETLYREKRCTRAKRERTSSFIVRPLRDRRQKGEKFPPQLQARPPDYRRVALAGASSRRRKLCFLDPVPSGAPEFHCNHDAPTT